MKTIEYIGECLYELGIRLLFIALVVIATMAAGELAIINL